MLVPRACLTFALLMAVACVHRPPVAREPASATSERNAGGLNEDEVALCSDLECRQFIAPCALRDRNKEKVLSAMDEVYINEIEADLANGFCPEAPRRLTGEGYSKETCLFLFVKRERCHS